jgi:preprotein translocase subunit SecG
MYTVLIVFHVLLAVALVAVVLVQRGPGATMGAAFGSGESGTVFGSRGAAGFLTKLTSWLGVAFFAVSLTMAVMLSRSTDIQPGEEDLGVAGQIASQPTEAQSDAADAASSEAEGDEASSEDEFLEVPVEEDTTGEDDREPPSVD